MKLKYIMLDHDLPIIFGDFFGHKDIAVHASAGSKVTGAGYVRQDALGNWIAYDQSVSLRLKPGPNDSKVLHKLLTGGEDLHQPDGCLDCLRVERQQ